MTKPLPALGLVIGVIATYVGMVCASYATTRLMLRMQTFRVDMGHTLPWLAALVAIAVVLGLLMMVPAIGSGVTTGAGALLSVVGVAVLLLPVRQAFDLSKLFQFPGTQYSGYMLFDGAFILFGIPLLLVGLRRWAVDAKLAKLAAGPGQIQDSSGYQSTFPQQQPQQWGGYPGQQQQPPTQHQQQHPGQQPPR
ncbi:hypothetical protein [Kribbella sp. NPDC004875]|uniref:hypothetical protein n=1 Tax=Kribbella sp. NPDC004875 TaxID=3364107 RepID=UPI0036CEBB40